jgi:hypothetical protein
MFSTQLAQTSRVFGLAILASGCAAAEGDAFSVETQIPTAQVEPVAPLVYAPDRALSPIDDALAHRLRAVIAGGEGSPWVVAKIGDSMTVARSYLGCFSDDKHVTLADHGALRATIDWFTASTPEGVSMWSRKSLAAKKGWAAFHALAGAPSPIERELAAISPAFATVMFGTNDIGFANISRYGRNLLDITDLLLAKGVVPILSSIPPRDDDPTADAWVPRYNAVVRAVAQARQVPFVDLHRDLDNLRSHGLTGDNVHLDSQGSGCTFAPIGMLHGNNRRNLLTLEMLDRLRRAVLLGEPAPDAKATRLVGEGTATAPYVIPALPFGDGRDTRAAGERNLDRYACGKGKASDASGAEIHYRLVVGTSTRLRAYVIDRSGDHDLYLVRDGDPAQCLARGDLALGTTLGPGTYDLVVDTYGERAGEYLLAVTDR